MPKTQPPAPEEVAESGVAAMDAHHYDEAALGRIWSDVTNTLGSNPKGGARLTAKMRSVFPSRLAGRTLTLSKPPDASSLVNGIIGDPETRELIEAELSRRFGASTKIELIVAPATLPVTGSLNASVPPLRDEPTRPLSNPGDSMHDGNRPVGHGTGDFNHGGGEAIAGQWDAAPSSAAGMSMELEENNYSGPIPDEEELARLMADHAPPAIKLERLLEKNERLRRAVSQCEEIFDGRVVRLDDMNL